MAVFGCITLAEFAEPCPDAVAACDDACIDDIMAMTVSSGDSIPADLSAGATGLVGCMALQDLAEDCPADVVEACDSECTSAIVEMSQLPTDDMQAMMDFMGSMPATATAVISCASGDSGHAGGDMCFC